MNKTWVLVLSAVLLAACAQPGKRTAAGSGIGAATGAGIGAVLGNQSGSAGRGAVIGAVAGGVLGGAIGNRMDRQARELAAVAETRRTETGIVTTLRENLLFDTNSADMKGSAQDSLGRIGGILKKYPDDRVVVVGYTDSTGSETYNQELSERRARAVRLALINQGMPAASVEAVGQGESSPVAPNDTASGRARNRRVELIISPSQAG